MLNFYSNLLALGDNTPPSPSDILTPFFVESFASEPFQYMQASPSFTVNNGLVASGVGGMQGNQFQLNVKSFLDLTYQRVKIEVNDTNSQIGIGGTDGGRGTMAKIDLNAKTIELGNLTDASQEPAYAVTESFTFEISVGELFYIEMIRKSAFTFVTLKGITDSNKEVTLSSYQNTNYTGLFYQRPCVRFLGGGIRFYDYEFGKLNDNDVKVCLYGDSITEGYTLITDGEPGSLNARWGYKLYQSNNSTLFSGRGGETSTGLLTRIDFDLDVIQPEYAVLLIGTNDTDFNTWKTNYDSFISRCLSFGVTPVLCTLPPRATNQAFNNQVNNEILNVYGLTYNVIDIARAVSQNGDRETWVPEYVLADGVHPTSAGYQRIYDNEIVPNHQYLF